MQVKDSQTSQNLAGLNHYNPREQVSDSKKVIVSPHVHDSISSMKTVQPVKNEKPVDSLSTSKSKLQKTKASLWTSFLELFGIKTKNTEDKSEKADETVSRPSLEKPNELDIACNDQFITNANKVLQKSHQIEKEIDELIGKKPVNETQTMKLFIQCLIDQRKALGEIADVTTKIITTMQDENRALEKNYLDGKSEFRKSQKHAKIASWIGNALTIATGIVGAATWALATLSTGGAAAIPAGVLIAQTFLGVSGAASQITSSVLDYTNGGKHAELIGMEETREMKNSDIQKLMEELNQQLEMIQAKWNQQRQVLQNIYSVARMA